MNIFQRILGKKSRLNENDRLSVPSLPVGIPTAWDIGSQMTKDYIAAHQYAKSACTLWEYYTPYFEWVPCNNDELKPAIFLKVGDDYSAWSRTTELRAFTWDVDTTDKYSLLHLSAYFEDSKQRLIGCGAPESITIATTDALVKIGHKMICHQFFDPADIETKRLLTVWAKMQGVTVVFFVQDECSNMNFVYYELTIEARAVALNSLAEAAGICIKKKYPREQFALEYNRLQRKMQSAMRW